jgi:hypothetical protein
VDEIALDYLMVADGAQAVGGKLYILGGGWTHLFLPAFPGRAPHPFAVAVGITIPWNKTNTKFRFALELHDADGNLLDEEATPRAEFEQGRPPGLRPGTPQRIVFAVPIFAEFPEPGRYSFHVMLDEREIGSTAIEVIPAPAGLVHPVPEG